METFKTALLALLGFGLLLFALVAEVKAAEPFSTAWKVIAIVNGTMQLHDRITRPQAAPAPAAPAPVSVVAMSRPRPKVAMVVLPPSPVYRDWFENSMVAADYPREKGVPEPLPLDQWKELMDDLAMPYRCSGRRPTACEIPGDRRYSFRVFFDVTYEEA